MTHILELMHAFRRSKILFTAVRLGIFDRLETAPATAAQLAADLNLHPGALTRLLDACIPIELLTREGDLYRNTSATSRALVTASPDSLVGYILHSDRSLYPLWGRLDDAVREGTNRWEQVFGDRGSLFDHYFRDPVSMRSFLTGMHGAGQLTSDRIVRAFDLSRFEHLIDLGGATGHLAIAACHAYPKLRATVLDLPAVEPYAREFIANAGLTDRIDFKAADFFQDDLPPADLYGLGRILHDWDDARIQTLLSKIHGDLLVTEVLMDEDRGPPYAMLQDLNMLVCTDGKERTASEYEHLLQLAGFQRFEFHRTNSLLDGILACR
ncbi:MAG TPA: methyltransferase [Bryobacteraceae bacterium]|jgi:acetylserotonin N-methyltransferase